MKIAYFTDTYLPQLNGVSLSIKDTAEKLREAGHEVYIFAPSMPGGAKDKNTIRLSSFKLLSAEPDVRVPMLKLDKSYKKIMSLDFDIVHGHGNGAFSVLGFQVARMKNVPYVLTFHTMHTKYTHYILRGKVLNPKMVATALRVFGNLCDGVVAPSLKMKKELLSYGIKKPIEVIPSFIEIGRFENKSKGFLRKKLNIPQGDSILMSVGRIGKEKNFQFLIKSFAKVYSENEKVHLVLVGEGPEEKKLRELGNALGLKKSLHFTKNIDPKHMPEAYSDADIFLFSSKTETLGLAVVEALASGLPAVVVEDDAFDGFVTPKNGFALPLSQKKFSEAIITLLSNKGKREEMGRESKKTIEKMYGDQKITSQLIGYYTKIISENKKSGKKSAVFPRASMRVISYASSAVERLFK